MALSALALAIGLWIRLLDGRNGSEVNRSHWNDAADAEAAAAAEADAEVGLDSVVDGDGADESMESVDSGVDSGALLAQTHQRNASLPQHQRDFVASNASNASNKHTMDSSDFHLKSVSSE